MGPNELPDPVRMTVTRYYNASPPMLPRLDDNFTVDYRFVNEQQRFEHHLLHPGCVVVMDGNDWNAPSNTWAWYTYPNGTSYCIKGFSNVTLLSTNFVRRSSIRFSQAGRTNI